MSTVNTIDKFGRSGFTKKVVLRGPPGTGFKLTKDKNYDIQGKRLKNIGEPVDGKDSATRNYVNEKNSQTSEYFINLVKETSNFSTTWATNYIDGQNLQLKEKMETYVHTQSSHMEQNITDLIAKNQEELNRKIKNIEENLSAKIKKLDRFMPRERGSLLPPQFMTTREIDA